MSGSVREKKQTQKKLVFGRISVDKLNGNDRSGLSGELNKYEGVIINFLWLIMLVLIISDALICLLFGQATFKGNVFLVQGIILAFMVASILIRVLVIGKKQIKPGLSYIIIKLVDILLLVILVNIVNHGYMFYFAILLPIISICITRGFKTSVPYLGVAFVFHIAVYFIVHRFDNIFYLEYFTTQHAQYLFLIGILYLIFLVFLRIIGTYYNQFSQNEKDNQNLVDQLGNKYAQLEEARKEKQDQYDKLKEVNLQLEDSNKKLTSSIAEFFTLQQISQAISSIFDMNELLQFVNDIIIGVMGVSTSNIALYGSGSDRLKVQVSNIYNKKERAILTDNINTPYLKDAVDKGTTILNNTVNPDDFDFTRGRNIRSLLCVPFLVKGKSHGCVLIEHTIPEAFDEDNVRLLEIITQQISIAIDNARLYEQLQEFANTDGLTQIYNRVFFQNRLQHELEQAQQLGYEVSVILYDIDNFKRFNDTYGHLFGDIVLKTLAKLVKESIRKDDIVARFGGEEFIVLLPHTGKELAYEKAEELRKKISELTIRDQSIEASVTVSMGVSTFPTLAQTELTLINSADEALYVAKKSGKNCVRTANPA
ncbi:MAG: sensor domain-containing diguanylate cyclase [Ruminiclostridium sp.]|nr:sensor domain-containing diguanylate cyclase [Ruminiclostridium sp.]